MQNKLSEQQTYRLHVFFRAATASVWGYVFCTLVSVLISYIFPASQAHAIAWSSMVFYILYAVFIMWVFSVQNWRNAIYQLTGVTIVLATIVVAIHYMGRA